MAEVEEAISHCVEQERFLGESLILGLHHTLMKDVPEEPGHPVKPGQIRDYTDKMDAADVEYLQSQMSPAWRVREDLISLLDATEESRLPGDSLEQVARFHYRFTRIHPFCDGNGRMARALSIFLMARGEYPEVLRFREPVNQVILDHRGHYVDVLEHCDGVYKRLEHSGLSEDEKLKTCEVPFVVFYARIVLIALHKHVTLLEEDLAGKGYPEEQRTAPLDQSAVGLSLQAILNRQDQWESDGKA